MSWKGKNGTGYVLDVLKELPENIMIVGTLSKTFGASGAVFITSDIRLRNRIKNFGGPLTFSAQLEPASVAAASASADIHLSPEITILQDELAQKIVDFNTLIKATSLPMIAPNNSPVFFLGTAMPSTAYRLVQRLFNEGYFVNPGLYPAVPVKNSGIRITVSRNNQHEDIKGLVQALEYHFPKALEETANTLHKVSVAFGFPEIMQEKEKLIPQTSLTFQYEKSIKQIDKATWNTLLGGQSTFDWDGLSFLEDAFKNSTDAENNWSFHYYLISDKSDVPLLATFFTFGLWKDDMLAPESVSLQLEERRIQDPLYLTSKVLGMGSLFTEGNHCYINTAHPLSKDAVLLLLQQVEILNQKLNADMLVLRDFDEDMELNRMFHNHGFIKINMPETCIIQSISWNTIEEFTSTLSPRSKKHFTKEILPFEQAFDIMIKEELTADEITQGYSLYQNVKNNNYAVNTFKYSIDVFKKMASNPHWEFILLHLKHTEISQIERPLVGILFCYKNLGQTYVPSLIGMDYSIPKKFSLYRQLLFQGIKRAQELKYQRIDFGITATFEKRKLGANVIPKIGYIQAIDNFSMEFISTLQTK